MLPPIFLYWLSLEIKMAVMWCVECITKDQFSQRQNKISHMVNMAYQSICYIQRWITLFYIIIQVLIHNKRLFLLVNSTNLFKFDIFQWEYPNCVVSPRECVDMLDLYRTVRLDSILRPILVTLPLLKKTKLCVIECSRDQKSKGGSCTVAKIPFCHFFVWCKQPLWLVVFVPKIIQKIFSYNLRIFPLHVWKKKNVDDKKDIISLYLQTKTVPHKYTCISHTHTHTHT